MRAYTVHRKTGKPAHPMCASGLSNWRKTYSIGEIDWNELHGQTCRVCGEPFSDADWKTFWESGPWFAPKAEHGSEA